VAGEFAVTGGGGQARELAGVVAPGFVGGEQHPVMADAASFDLRGQPARREAERPTGVGVDPFAGGDPVEEAPTDELDVPAHAAAQVHQVDPHLVAVALD